MNRLNQLHRSMIVLSDSLGVVCVVTAVYALLNQRTLIAYYPSLSQYFLVYFCLYAITARCPRFHAYCAFHGNFDSDATGRFFASPAKQTGPLGSPGRHDDGVSHES